MAMLLTREKYRLVTRSDFDGLVCAVLLKDQELIDEIKFVHPKDMQDGKIEITDQDITTNLPYVPGVHLAFDHHASELKRNASRNDENYVINADAPSAARVVYNYFGGRQGFPLISEAMMAAVDKGDAAQFNLEEVLKPDGWNLLNFLMDARTGLGRFKQFRISNYALMMELIDYCKHHSIEEILQLPDVRERVDLYLEHQELCKDQIRRCARAYDNLVLLDLREEETIYAGNRFLIYALYPECNISIHALWGVNQQNTVFAVGKSIFNRSSEVHIGELMLRYGGGGHANAGTCQVDNEAAAITQEQLIRLITQVG